MKKLTIILISLVAFLISCQTRAEIINGKVNQTDNTQVFIDPTPRLKPNPEDENSKIGNVEVGNKCVRLFIENPHLKIGDKVQIVFTEVPQKILDAEIIEDTECKDDYFGDLTGNNPEAKLNFYLLKLSDEQAYLRGFGIGIVNLAKKIKVEKKFATVELDEDKGNEYFRECSSSEGLHLTVWKGKPLIGKRIWHSYYHFNYDTEPSCKDKDFEIAD